MANRLYFISTGSDATSTARAYDFSGVRQPDDDITIGAGFWQGGLASDTRIYFISNGTNTAVAYDFDGNRQSGDDISLVSNSWQGAVASDDSSSMLSVILQMAPSLTISMVQPSIMATILLLVWVRGLQRLGQMINSFLLITL